jgi:hypothetical protein
MQQQTTTQKPLQQLKTRVQHLRDDANNALHAARHDYEEVLHAMRDLGARSEVKAFVQSRFGNGHSQGHDQGEAGPEPTVSSKPDAPAEH